MKIYKYILGATVLSALAMPGAFAAEAVENVTYLLPAPASLPAFAPWMLASHKGYYAAEGLNVKFVTAKGGVDVAKQIGAGNAVLGGAVGDTPIIVRANGIMVRNVAVLGGGSMMHLAINKKMVGSGIDQLKGKTIGVMSYADTTYYALLGMLAARKMDKNAADIQASGPNVWQLFQAGKIPALASVPEWTVSARESGMDVEVIPADRYFQSMAQAIIASDESIRTKSALIRKFVRATLKGLQDIRDDPKAAAAAYVEAVPGYKGRENYIMSVFQLYNQLVYANQKTPGETDRARLDALKAFYVKDGIVRQAGSVDEFFTNEFVKN